MAISQPYPNTGTYFNKGGDPVGNTNSGLSTQIIIKVNSTPVGALQKLTVAQARPLERISEIGTDGVIEIVPKGPTTFDLTATRLVFDQVRLPEAFARAFRFINAQRLPFDIEIMDLSGVTDPGAALDSAAGIVTMTYKNCWFTSYSTPYAADNYLITEDATMWCETAYINNIDGVPNTSGARTIPAQTDNKGIETDVNKGSSQRRGSMDVSGLLNSVFKS